jgi:hypothetical protein
MFADKGKLQILSDQLCYTNDPKFSLLAESFKSLAYVFVHHIDLWLQAAKILEKFYMSFPSMHAGSIFQSLFISQKELDIFPNHLFEIVITSFNTAINGTPINRYCSSLNAFDTMFECCKYFFIPSRLNTGTLSHALKELSLRHWILLIMTLPLTKYSLKLGNLVGDVSIISDGIQSFAANPEKITMFVTNMQSEWVRNYIVTESYNKRHPAVVFSRTCMSVALFASMEIHKRYNPCIIEASKVNPTYNGQWSMLMVDSFFVDQVKKLHSLFELVQTEKK